MLSDKLFEESGYTEYPRHYFEDEIIEKHYQKRFDDELGKKYFIDVEKFGRCFLPNGSLIEENYEFNVQFKDKETNKPCNIKLFSGWTIKEAEKKVEEMWQSGLWEYYEKWEET